MGYDSGWESRQSLVKYITREWTENDHRVSCLKKVWKGLILWSVWENEDLSSGDRTRYIRCDACNRFKPDKDSSVEWGTRAMTESMGPCYYTCPLSFFADVPDPGGYATEWRAKCREYARTTSRVGLRVGDWIKLRRSTTKFLRVTSIRPFRCGVYRVPRRFIDGKADELNALQQTIDAFWATLPPEPFIPKRDPAVMTIAQYVNSEVYAAGLAAHTLWRDDCERRLTEWAQANPPQIPTVMWQELRGRDYPLLAVWLEMEKTNEDSAQSATSDVARPDVETVQGLA